ncbi:MAG: cytochrome c3 family protein [Nitrospiraceae bacterium]|nr:cytochrome c3 family protein [Nitrospiraceae bacterium]
MASISGKMKTTLVIAVIAFIAIGGFGAWKFWDFKENNPKFCIACHLMTPAYNAWATSEHAGINCHNCHHLSLMDQNKLLISFVFKNPKTVPPRHGEVIVPWKLCVNCHYDTNKEYPNAPKINNSPFHSRHFFASKIECTKCHGYIIHRFTPEPRFCVRCHQGKEVHGTGMEGLACLNCHTDRTLNLKPDRLKCLYCHGGDNVRKQLKEEDVLDVTHYQPDPGLVKKAVKIKVAEDSPMQFYCYECHKPHQKNIMPTSADCLRCHKNVPNTGKHPIHVGMMKMQCTQCHEPHLWRVTPQVAKKKCVTCHEYRAPSKFLE